MSYLDMFWLFAMLSFAVIPLIQARMNDATNVTMDFMAQVQNYVMSQQYESLLRKANFKGGIPTR